MICFRPYLSLSKASIFSVAIFSCFYCFKQRIEGYQSIEKVILKKMPSYIDPEEAERLFMSTEYHISPFQPDFIENKIIPESSISAINR